MTLRLCGSSADVWRFDEGLVILAWLAWWRLAEALICGWVPFYRNRRLFERLAGIKVFVRLSSSSGTPSHPAVAPRPPLSSAESPAKV